MVQREENKENTSGNAVAPVQESSILVMKRELFERSKQLKTAISSIQAKSPLLDPR